MNSVIKVTEMFYNIRFELYRFIENQRKIKFVNALVKRAGCPHLSDYLKTHLTISTADQIFIQLLESGTLYKGLPTREMVRTVSELSRKWAVKLAKFQIEYGLDRIRYRYVD